jgi:hypothetical protein
MSKYNGLEITLEDSGTIVMIQLLLWFAAVRPMLCRGRSTDGASEVDGSPTAANPSYYSSLSKASAPLRVARALKVTASIS